MADMLALMSMCLNTPNDMQTSQEWKSSTNALPLVTCAGTVHMTQGPIVLIMNQYAYYGKGELFIPWSNYHTLVLILMLNLQ